MLGTFANLIGTQITPPEFISIGFSSYNLIVRNNQPE
jgi:hypothetical protein